MLSGFGVGLRCFCTSHSSSFSISSPEARAFEHDDPFESERHEDEAAWDWEDDKVVVRD